VSRRRRAALLFGLALALGGLAASDVARREAALDRRIGPLVSLLVVRRAVPAGVELPPARLAARLVPARFAPPGAFRSADQVAGLRTRAPLPAGAYLTPAAVADPAAAGAGLAAELRRGERLAEVTATADPRYVVAGARVDVVVTRESDGAAPGRTVLALRDAQVLEVRKVPDGASASDRPDEGPLLRVSLRVTLRQALYLASAQSFARQIRLLARGS
jgi:pilus assembly protein CpaB